jgi:hypothetical protein
MNVVHFPDDLFSSIVGLCDGAMRRALANTCRRMRTLINPKRHCRLVASPVRIQSGMFVWLYEYMKHTPPTGRMGALSINYVVSPPFSEGDLGFFTIVALAGTIFHNLRLVIQNSPLSMVRLTNALQSLQPGGQLVLDLSYQSAVVASKMHPLWTAALCLSTFRLKLHNTDVTDTLAEDIARAIHASLDTPHPVAWKKLKLGFSHNFITDRGLLALAESIGKCPHLKDVNINLSYNDIRHPDKLSVVSQFMGHIPALHIKMDSDCWDTELCTLHDVPTEDGIRTANEL